MNFIRRNRRVLSSSSSENASNVANGSKDAIKGLKDARPNIAFGTRKIATASKTYSKPVAPEAVEKPQPKIGIPKVASISEYELSKDTLSLYEIPCFDDQHNYLLYLERCRSIPVNFLHQKGITGKMRSVLFDWMLQVQERFNLHQETLHLAFIVVDRCLHRMDINKDKLQLLGSTSLFIASKYEEVTIPHIHDFVYLAASCFTMRDIIHMEREVFKAVDFNLGYAFPIHFLRRYRAVLQNGDITHPLSKMFCDLFMLTYELGHKLPSVMAQVALYIAYFVCGKELPENIYGLMGTTPQALKKECNEYVGPIIAFCTSPKELTLHRKYVSSEVNPRLSQRQLERLKNFKSF